MEFVGTLSDKGEIVLRRLVYVGTHPTANKELSGVDVAFASSGITFTKRGKPLGAISWEDVSDLSAFSERLPGRVSAPAVLLFGPLGFLFKSSGRRVVLKVGDKRGDWLFDVPGIKIGELRGGIEQIRSRYINPLDRFPTA